MICITFDTDHMNEARMAEFLERIRFPGAGTFFCTQHYTCLESTSHELAPHPILEAGEDWSAELQRMRQLFPSAIGWRSHSCVFSHLLAEWLSTNGYRYVSTNDQFGQNGIQPVRHPWGLWHFPIFYMDNMDFSSSVFWAGEDGGPFSESFVDKALKHDGVYVFDFHPIHLLLNSPDREYYFSVRDRFKAGEDIDRLTFKGPGTATFFERLSTGMERSGAQSLTLGKALEVHLAH